MKNTKLVALTALVAVFAATAHAQQATEQNGASSIFTPAGLGYVSATVVSTTDPVLITLPVTDRTLLSHACSTRDSADRMVPRDLEVSTSIRIDDAAGMTSGTLAVGDKVNCVLFYQR